MCAAVSSILIIQRTSLIRYYFGPHILQMFEYTRLRTADKKNIDERRNTYSKVSVHRLVVGHVNWM